MITSVTMLLAAGVLLSGCQLTLFSPRYNQQASRWMGVLFFGFAFTLIHTSLEGQALLIDNTALQIVFEIPVFVIAPALYLAIMAFTTANYQASRRDLVHFIPLAIFGIGLVIGLQHLLPEQLLPPNGSRWIGLFVMAFIRAQALVYWILSFRRLTKYRRTLKVYSADVTTTDLAWVQWFLIAIAAAIVLWIVTWLFHSSWLEDFVPFGYLIVAMTVTYFGITQRELFPYSQKHRDEIQSLNNPSPDAVTSLRLSDDEIEANKARVEELMAKKKLFLDPDLSLPRMAEEAGLSTHALSYLLNTGFGENFYAFVNRYRVEEAKYLLTTRIKTLSMLGIAYEAGFRSKTTFNNAFKKHTGLSPSQYVANGEGNSEAASPA
ncbi:helix-turn-helix domain-containing protein [Chryseolinea sp. T2]|uniref:helix-turn-helix domain-containing protein n=1 Tax=Chryseolinea sp. T2 TaxID=3129255 RepID=UPI003077328A